MDVSEDCLRWVWGY